MIKYTDEQKKQAVILRKTGISYDEIALKLGFNNIATISNLCEKAGLQRNLYRNRINYKVGMRFFNFTIVQEGNLHVSKQGRLYPTWKCLCDCGVAFTTTTKQIRKGIKKSCGCLSRLNRFRALPTEIAVCRSKLANYKQSARIRGIEWHLTEEQFLFLIKQNCYYCKVPPMLKITRLKHDMFINGVDRVNNDGHYTIDNVVSCCMICNRAKLDLTEKEFKIWIRRLANAYSDN